MGLFTSNLSFDLLCIVATLCCVLYYYINYWLTYWDRRGIKSLKPTFPFGNFGKTFLMKRSMGELTRDFYNSTDEPYIGIYGSLRPVLLVRDPELIRKILIKDFNYFPNRGIHVDEVNDPLSGHLFALEDQKWKTLRSKLSPTFTSGKLKAMFPTLIECSKVLEEYLDKRVENKEEFEVRELSASHSTNVIASVAFGIDINCIYDSNEAFRVAGRKIFEPSLRNAIRGVLNFICPRYMQTFGFKAVDHDVEDFMMSVVKNNLDLREKNNITRKDFFQLLVQMRNGMDVSKDDQWTSAKRTDGKYELSVGEVAAQSFVFFAAGFETSSTALSWCMYELVKKPELLARVHKELDEVLERHNGEFTYDSLNEMKFLEKCIDGKWRLIIFFLSFSSNRFFFSNYRNTSIVPTGTSFESS